MRHEPFSLKPANASGRSTWESEQISQTTTYIVGWRSNRVWSLQGCKDDETCLCQECSAVEQTTCASCIGMVCTGLTESCFDRGVCLSVHCHWSSELCWQVSDTSFRARAQSLFGADVLYLSLLRTFKVKRSLRASSDLSSLYTMLCLWKVCIWPEHWCWCSSFSAFCSGISPVDWVRC